MEKTNYNPADIMELNDQLKGMPLENFRNLSDFKDSKDFWNQKFIHPILGEMLLCPNQMRDGTIKVMTSDKQITVVISSDLVSIVRKTSAYDLY